MGLSTRALLRDSLWIAPTRFAPLGSMSTLAQLFYSKFPLHQTYTSVPWHRGTRYQGPPVPWYQVLQREQLFPHVLWAIFHEIILVKVIGTHQISIKDNIRAFHQLGGQRGPTDGDLPTTFQPLSSSIYCSMTAPCEGLLVKRQPRHLPPMERHPNDTKVPRHRHVCPKSEVACPTPLKECVCMWEACPHMCQTHALHITT